MARPNPDYYSGLGTALCACHRWPLNGYRYNSRRAGAEEQDEGFGLTDRIVSRIADMAVPMALRQEPDAPARFTRYCFGGADRRALRILPWPLRAMCPKQIGGPALRAGVVRTGAPISTAESQEETHLGLSSNPVAPTTNHMKPIVLLGGGLFA